MWRNFVKIFGRSLILNSRQLYVKRFSFGTHLNYIHLQHKQLCSGPLCNTVTLEAATPVIREGDAEYIVPYKVEYEKPDSSKKLIEALRTKFRLSEQDVEHIMKDEVVLRSYRRRSLLDTMEILCMEGVTKKNFVEYPWVITLDKNKLLAKIKILKSLNGFRDLNDFLPFLRLQTPRLFKLVASLNREFSYIDCDNRIYFIAEKLNVPVSVVIKYMVKRLFVLEMPLEMFKTNLQHMINYKVEPMSILKDLWGFRYAPGAVEVRLKRALQAKKDKIMPWMVRCPESILQKSLQLSLDELKVLGNKATVAEYIGERLGFSAEEAQTIMNRHPQVNTVRVKKIKDILDYLLNEAQFTRHEIAQVPRILCHSLGTTKQRIEELKKYGCRPSSLVILCRSKREYDKFLYQWKKTYNSNESATKQEIKEKNPND